MSSDAAEYEKYSTNSGVEEYWGLSFRGVWKALW